MIVNVFLFKQFGLQTVATRHLNKLRRLRATRDSGGLFNELICAKKTHQAQKIYLKFRQTAIRRPKHCGVSTASLV